MNKLISQSEAVAMASDKILYAAKYTCELATEHTYGDEGEPVIRIIGGGPWQPESQFFLVDVERWLAWHAERALLKMGSEDRSEGWSPFKYYVPYKP
jgi:hypothetical protein